MIRELASEGQHASLTWLGVVRTGLPAGCLSPTWLPLSAGGKQHLNVALGG